MIFLNHTLSTYFKLLICMTFACGLSACATTPVSAPKKLTQAEVERHDRAMIHTRLAQGYMQQNQHKVAKTELDRALQIAPNHSNSNYVMALLMLRLEQYPEARRYFTKAVKADSQNSPAAHDFGTFLCQMGDREQAVEYFDIAVANPLFDQSKISYARAGQCLAPIDPTRAEAYLRKALELDARLRPALFSLAQIKYTDNSFLSARAYIERYLAITNPQPAALYLAYQIESSLKSSEQAKRYRSQLLNEFPGSKEANRLRSGARS